jgi:dihydropteroate synthase
MGIVNASPDSFSDGGDHDTADDRVRHGLAMVAEGATVLDIGGQSGITGVPEIEDAEEIERVLPVVDGLIGRTDAVLSIDTYKPAVVEATLAAGATIINDVSGLLYPDVAGLCAEAGAGLVIMHNRTPPKVKLRDPDFYDDVVADVVGYLEEKMAVAIDAGLPEESIVVDPGPDFAKTAFQTIEVMRSFGAIAALGRPVLLALSRKDFIGALTGTRPRDRLAGTLAAFGSVCHHPGLILRVHDVAQVRDYLVVADALAGRSTVDPLLQLDPSLKWQQSAGDADQAGRAK